MANEQAPADVKLPPDDVLYAFPWHVAIQSPTGTTYATCAGMLLRDYFAGQALAGMLAARTVGNTQVAARDAYILADALMKARKETP